jgi:FkbM family methyltransferase
MSSAATASSTPSASGAGRLPVGLRCKHYCKYFLNKLTGNDTQLDVELAGQSVSLSVTARREIRRAHAVHHEVDFIERMSAALKPGDIVYDIGANIGVITVLLARHTSGNVKQVYSFEPEPRNFKQLCGNVAANSLEGMVSPQQMALGASNGEASLHVRGEAGEGRHSITEARGATDSITVPVQTATAFAESSGAAPSLVKIDVEGAEGQVLEGMSGLLSTRPPRDIFLEIHDKGDGDKMPDGRSIHQWFLDNDYHMAWNVERRSGEHRQYRSNRY